MRFNTKKCYVLSINNKSSRYYQLEKHTLQEVQDNPYLRLQIPNDLKWSIRSEYSTLRHSRVDWCFLWTFTLHYCSHFSGW
jgi:hypothetical protein